MISIQPNFTCKFLGWKNYPRGKHFILMHGDIIFKHGNVILMHGNFPFTCTKMKFLCVKFSSPKIFMAENSMHEIVYSPISLENFKVRKSSQGKSFHFDALKYHFQSWICHFPLWKFPIYLHENEMFMHQIFKPQYIHEWNFSPGLPKKCSQS